MMSHRPILVLLDIDGTLADFRGAGRSAMVAAGRAVFGPGFHMRGVRFGGRLDGDMVAEALRVCGLSADGDRMAGFKRRYVAMLAGLLRGQSIEHVRLVGVRRLLEAMDERDWVTTGVLTGNFCEAARVKLAAVGLGGEADAASALPREPGAEAGLASVGIAFVVGGDDGATRRELVGVAHERAAGVGRGPFERDRVLVIGDTPHDVDCARYHGHHAVAVATGRYDRTTLASAGADLVLDDLRDVAALLRIIDVD